MKTLDRAEWLFVTAMLLFAAGLRLVGITFGQPDPQYARSTYPRQMLHMQTPLQPDEYEFVAIPLQMVVQKTQTPGYVNRGFLSTFHFALFALTGAGDGLEPERDRAGVNMREYAPFHLYVVGRTFSALGGLAAVAATYATARQLAGRFAALSAAGIAAVSLTLVQHAHYTTSSSLSAGFTMLAVWASFASLRARRGWLFALACVCAGLAASSRFNAAGVAIVVMLAGLVWVYRERNRRTIRTVFLALLLGPIVFVITTPQVALEFGAFWDRFVLSVDEYTTARIAMFPVARDYGLLLEYRYLILFGLGAPAGLMIPLGLYAAWKSRLPGRHFLKHNNPALFVAILLVYLAATSAVVLRTVRPDGADQLLAPVIPPYALLAGLGAAWLYNRLPLPSALGAPLLALGLLVVPLVSSVQFVRQLTQPDTRQIMQAWIYGHVPAGARVQLDGPYNVPLDKADYVWTQNFGGDLKSPEALRAEQIDYVVVSDAWYFSQRRAWETVPREYIEQVEAHVESYGGLTAIARIERPRWTGYDWMGHTPSYWHNPGLTVYCLTEASCAAVR